MPSEQTTQETFSKERSIDSLLADVKKTPTVQERRHSTESDQHAQGQMSGASSRRNVSDPQGGGGKWPRGTLERKADDSKRAKRAKQAKSQEELLRHQNEEKLQQHRKKILLAGCEPVMGYNYDSLAMDDYPENSLVSAARRDRDYWLLICALFSSLFFFGLLGFVDGAIAGVGCGLAFISAVFAFSPIRRYFFVRPHLHTLLSQRKQMEFTALNHIQFLEGKDGLAWRCYRLAKYNSNLNKKLFSGLYHYSKERQMLNVIKNKKHIRLYLLLMIESQKAYKRLEKDYLERHFKHLDAGWDDRIELSEVSKLEQLLNPTDNSVGRPSDS